MRKFKQFLFLFVAAMSATLNSNVFAADHQEAPALVGRGQLDLNDLYVFQAPGNAANSVLILTVNPFAGVQSPTTFGNTTSGVVYEFSIDSTGDAVADITYSTTFTGSGASQAYTVSRNGITVANGVTGSISNVTGGGFVTAGEFDDPFFFDLVGFRNTLNGTGTFTGANAFGAANISAIVLEIPSVQLGNVNVGIEARTLENGLQVDRTGRPAISAVLIPAGAARDAFNASTPATDFANFGATVNARILALSGNQALADALDGVLLPDLMTYDSSIPSGYLNGRRLEDDVIDFSLNLLTNGAITTDLAGNDSAFSGIFPYLAPAQAIAVPEPTSLTLLATCAAGFAGVRRLRRRSLKNVE